MGNPGPTQTCLPSKIRAESLLFSVVSIHPNCLWKPGKKHCMSKEFMSKLSPKLESQRRHGYPLGRMFTHKSVIHNEKEITGQRAPLSYCFAVNMDYVFNRLCSTVLKPPPNRKPYFHRMDHTSTCFPKSKPSVHWESFYGLRKGTYRRKISTFL